MCTVPVISSIFDLKMLILFIHVQALYFKDKMIASTGHFDMHTVTKVTFMIREQLNFMFYLSTGV